MSQTEMSQKVQRGGGADAVLKVGLLSPLLFLFEHPSFFQLP